MKLWQAVALVSIPALALVLAVLSDSSERQASAGDSVATAGIDLDPSTNSADSLGTIETCLQVAPGSTMSIHTWVNGIPSNRTLAGFSYNLVFGAGAAVSTHDHEYLLAINPGSVVTDVSEVVPDATSPHSVGALETSGYPPAGEVDGVLGAYSLAIDAGASGYMALSLDLFALSDASAKEIPSTTFGAMIAVAPLTCDGITPQVTPPISATDCVTWTATPTVTPSPDPTPRWMPRSERLICNDTVQTVSDLHVLFAKPAAFNGSFAMAAPPGCPDGLVAWESGAPAGYASINIDWGTPCVGPGEWVSVGFVVECTTPEAGCTKPGLVCAYWTVSGQPVTPASPAPAGVSVCPSPSPIPTLTATPSPIPSPTLPCPAGPDPSGGCLPCPTAQPLVAAAPVVLSTCPPIVTPTPTPTPTKVIPTPPCPAGTYPSGDCLPCPTAQPLVAAAPVVLSTCPPLVTPTPTATPLTDVQGDSNCDGGINAADALAVLRMNAGLAIVVPPYCTGFDGDVDCSLSTNAVDSLKILRHNAVLSVTQNEPCPDIGTVE